MKEGPSGLAIRSLIPSHRKLLSSGDSNPCFRRERAQQACSNVRYAPLLLPEVTDPTLFSSPKARRASRTYEQLRSH
jgi:hypothetical protein